MSLALLVPAFLLGLGAMIVPIVVHLRHRERKEPIRFPSLMFLARVPHRSSERRRLTHPWLLVLRALALTALVLAFARPFLRRSADRPAGARSRRALILVLDRSMSMGYRGVWERARDSALGALGRLGPGDQAALIAVADQAELVAPLDADLTRLRSVLLAEVPTGGGTRLASGLRLAREVAASAHGFLPEIVLISDLQRQGVQGLETVERIPNAGFSIVSVAPDRPTNATVASVDVDRSVDGKRVRLAVGARIVSRNREPRSARATLTVNGRVLAETPARLSPNGATSIRFEPVIVSEGDAVASVQLDPDQLPADDTLRFALGAATGIRVALLLPAGARPDETVFLERALAISDAPRLAIDEKRGSGIPDADLARVSAAVVSDAGTLTTGGAQSLAQFVRKGGGLVLFAGSRSGPAVDRAGVWPARLGPVVDRSADRGATLGYLNRDHPALEPFKDAIGSDFGTARFFRYRELIPDSAAETVARFDDGRPAIVEGRLGTGRILEIASSSDGIWSDLPLQPVFLPLLHRLVTYVAQTAEEKRAYSVGDGLTLTTRSDVVVRAPDGTSTKVAADSGARVVPLAAAGFYSITGSDRRAEEIAVNPPAAESDLTTVSPADVEIMIRAPADSARRIDPLASLPLAEQERAQSWWVYFLATVLALLAIEAWYAGRLTRRVRASGGVG
jgi:Mg-chelatase subunit ChlD